MRRPSKAPRSKRAVRPKKRPKHYAKPLSLFPLKPDEVLKMLLKQAKHTKS